MKALKPKKLPVGSTLGVIAPSTPIVLSEEAVSRGYDRLRERGFKLVEAPQCRMKEGHTAGSISDRVEAIHDFFRRPDIDGIITFWGGFQSHQLLEYLDFDLIKKNPKALLGYSDVTSLSVGIYSQTGLVGFSSPAVISFVKPSLPPETWDSLQSAVCNGDSPLTYRASREFSDNRWFERGDGRMLFEPTPPWTAYRKGTEEGVLVGGNAGTLLLLAGTPYWPDLKNKILFLEEDEEEKPQTIDRCFTHLRQMGVFEEIAGLVIGRFPRCVNFSSGDTLFDILEDSLKGFDFPVLCEVDYGHTDPILTLPIGIRARLDCNEQTLTLLEPATV